LTGPPPSELARLVDCPLGVRGVEGPEIQETHLAVEHALCTAVEERLFGDDAEPPIGATAASKVIGYDDLVERREAWRDAGLRVVWTNGCFDLLHVGHVRSLEAARALGDVLVVGLNGDRTVRELKGEGRPLMPAAQRAEIVAALEVVDHVVIFEEATPEAALARLQPDIHAKGADYKGKPLPEREVVESYGGRVEFLPLVPEVSTTALVERLR
jgi:rfaE bifunctional protein nucleotidyltransferase chain/domain